MCTTRLDRWYVPTGDNFDGTLWNVTVEDSLVWKDSPSDHLPVTLLIEGTEGERGHERKNIRGDLMERPEIQQLVLQTVEKAYDMGGNVEEKWTRAHNMMRSVLLAETVKARKKDASAILEARGHLEIIRKKVVRHGLTPSLQAQRETKQKELLKLERPEVKPNDPETAKRMADQSDKCTRAMFQSYKGIASQQWINEMKVALEWKDGHEPSYSWGGRTVNKTTHAKQVPGAIRDYYQMLFAEKEYDSEASRRLLEEIGKDQITSVARKQLDKPISDQEIQEVMEALPTGKQAGPDRIPNEVYKYLSAVFAPKLGALIRRSITRKTLPEEMRKGAISVLFKKGDRDEVRNYRPITQLH